MRIHPCGLILLIPMAVVCWYGFEWNKVIDFKMEEAKQSCQIAIGEKSASWPRGKDGRCHIEDLQKKESP